MKQLMYTSKTHQGIQDLNPNYQHILPKPIKENQIFFFFLPKPIMETRFSNPNYWYIPQKDQSEEEEEDTSFSPNRHK